MKIKKHEFKAIRMVLGMTQKEYADFLGISVPHVQKSEHVGNKSAYGISDKLDSIVKQRLIDMGLDLEEVIQVGLQIMEENRNE